MIFDSWTAEYLGKDKLRNQDRVKSIGNIKKDGYKRRQ